MVNLRIPVLTSHQVDELAAQMHVMFGMPGCASCGSALYGSTWACWNCLEHEMRQQPNNLAERIQSRTQLLALFRLPQSDLRALKPQRRVFRWSYRNN